MKILYIYQNKIIAMNGGSLESRKIFHALEAYANKHANVSVDSLSLEDSQIQKNRQKDLMARFFGHSNYLFFEWNKIKEEVFANKYDLVVLGHSRLGFIAKDLKQHNSKIRVITQFHNIEYDYVEVYKSKFHPILQPLFTRLERRAILNDEYHAIRSADYALFMTPQDRNRCKELYQSLPDHSIIPICTKAIQTDQMKENEIATNLVFIGALDYPSNIDGLRWFLKHVWTDLQDHKELHLIIGGSKPQKDLITEIESYKNLETHYNFDTFESIVPTNSIFLSFVTSTAGMKTKAAEALAAGLMVIATDETYIGYEEALADPISKNIMIHANSAKTFKHLILENAKQVDYSTVREKAVSLWNTFYSTDRANQEITRILKALCDET